MKLWLLLQKGAPVLVGYDEAGGFVVRANSPEAARQLAALQCGCEGQETWRDAERSTCSRLTDEGEEQVILRDFNAG